MKVHMFYDSDKNFLSIKPNGVLKTEVLVRTLHLASDLGEKSKAFKYLYDASSTDLKFESSESIERYVKTIYVSWKGFRNVKFAIFSPSDLSFGMARMFQAYMGNSQVKTMPFRSLQEAKTWLDMAADKITIDTV